MFKISGTLTFTEEGNEFGSLTTFDYSSDTLQGVAEKVDNMLVGVYHMLESMEDGEDFEEDRRICGNCPDERYACSDCPCADEQCSPSDCMTDFVNEDGEEIDIEGLLNSIIKRITGR